MDSLQHRYRNDSTVTDLLHEHQQTVKAAALLHDVGHGPFSQVMERAFQALRRHEGTTISIIVAARSAVFKVLEQHNVDPRSVADIIDKVSPHRLLVDIVSSQLDADRMDYILRDALATGVKYGAFDAEWLINSLCIGSEPGVSTVAGEKHWRLCLEEKRGLHSAEQLVIARMHMSLQVYFHRATRGWEAHLLSLFRLAADLAAENRLPGKTPPIVRRFFEQKGELKQGDLLLFDEVTLISALQIWSSIS